MGVYFDWENMAEELGISAETTAQIVLDAENDFPDDLMMCELHIIRALRSVYQARRGEAA